MRLAAATASARTLPSSTSGFAWAKNVKTPSIEPPATARAASPEPRYGTPTMLVPAAALSCAVAIAGDEAGPDVPKLNLVGSALAAATNSGSVLYGSLALMMRTTGGPSTIQPTFAKSSTGL